MSHLIYLKENSYIGKNKAKIIGIFFDLIKLKENPFLRRAALNNLKRLVSNLDEKSVLSIAGDKDKMKDI